MSDSHKIEKVKEYFYSRNLNFYERIELSHIDDCDILITVKSDHIKEKKDKFNTSLAQMNVIKSVIKKKYEINICWIIAQGEKQEAYATAIKSVLESDYPNIFESITISSTYYDPVWIWIYTKKGVQTPPSEKELTNTIRSISKNFKVKEPIIYYEVQNKLPSNPEILLVLKIYSPINIELLKSKLESKEYYIPSVEWLKTKVETLRKKGLIVWAQNSMKYTLSLPAHSLFTYSANKKNSPDVLRALELGKRKW